MKRTTGKNRAAKLNARADRLWEEAKALAKRGRRKQVVARLTACFALRRQARDLLGPAVWHLA